MFRRYLIIGGLPAAVNTYLETRNIVKVRAVHEMISKLYCADESKYDSDRKLKIERIYDMIPSSLENKKSGWFIRTFGVLREIGLRIIRMSLIIS